MVHLLDTLRTNNPHLYWSNNYLIERCYKLIKQDNMYLKPSRSSQGRIQDFKLGGGMGNKKIAPSGGGRENCWGISCEKSRLYAKKSYFFQFQGGRAGCAPPSWIRPCVFIRVNKTAFVRGLPNHLRHILVSVSFIRFALHELLC